MNVRRRKVSSGDAEQQALPEQSSDGAAQNGAAAQTAETDPAPAPVSPRGDTPQPQPSTGRARFPTQWGNVITDVFRIDIDAAYARLNKELTLGEGASEYGAVLRALDNASRNALDAARLVRAAKIADEKFSGELEERLEVMRTSAREQLEREKSDQKAAGKAAKAPTLQEVQDRMIASWPDEVRSLTERKGEMHGAFRSIEALEKAWWNRCADLRVMADRFNAGRG